MTLQSTTAPSSRALSTTAWTNSTPYAQAIANPAVPLVLHTDAGEQIVLDADRFTAPPDDVDRSVLDRCQGPTLDLGCGPGRLVAELARRGVPALGVDVAPAAVLAGRAAGAAVLRRSVFDRLPGVGRWPHALLMDGNIGIGGDPGALLERMGTLLLPRDGELVIETEPEDILRTYQVSFTGFADSADFSQGFGWTRMGTEALVTLAEERGFEVRESWTRGGRRFVALSFPGRP